MKNYELMGLLSEMPAGADVEVRQSLTVKELIEKEKIDDDIYTFSSKVEAVEDVGDNRVFIYLY